MSLSNSILSSRSTSPSINDFSSFSNQCASPAGVDEQIPLIFSTQIGDNNNFTTCSSSFLSLTQYNSDMLSISSLNMSTKKSSDICANCGLFIDNEHRESTAALRTSNKS
jgi:hypothetical protein